MVCEMSGPGGEQKRITSEENWIVSKTSRKYYEPKEVHQKMNPQ